MHKLTERQFTWVSLLARAKRYQWKDCEELVITKSWLGGKKTKASINPEKVVQILYDNGAPGDVLQGNISNIHHCRFHFLVRVQDQLAQWGRVKITQAPVFVKRDRTVGAPSLLLACTAHSPSPQRKNATE